MLELSGKKIGVTGGGGFLGKHVIRELQKYTDSIHILAPRSSEVDLTNVAQTNKFVEKCDLIIHLAADVGGILYNQKYPADLLSKNLQMGLNIINACKEYGIDKLVNTGTTCMFPANASLPFKEEDIFNGYPAEVTAPYGISKIVLFELSKAYKKQFGLNSINLIPVNLYGPEDHFIGESTHVVPALIRRIYAAKSQKIDKVDIWGTGVATREFLFAADAAEGIVKALLEYDSTEPVNLGTGIETSIKDLVLTIKNILAYNGEIFWDLTKPDGTLRRCVDVEKAKNEFGFSASTILSDGLEKTIEWYISNYQDIESKE